MNVITTWQHILNSVPFTCFLPSFQSHHSVDTQFTVATEKSQLRWKFPCSSLCTAVPIAWYMQAKEAPLKKINPFVGGQIDRILIFISESEKRW